MVSKTGVTVRDGGVLYKAVLESAFLYGSEIWVVPGAMLKVIEVFHHQVSRRMVEMTGQRMMGG